MKSQFIVGALTGALALSCLVIAQAGAATVYTYTGNNYDFTQDASLISGSYDTSMSVNGSFTLASPLAPNTVQFIDPLNFSFSDGRTTISNANAYAPGSAFFIGTGNTGEITLWSIILANAPAPSAVGDQRARISSDINADVPEISGCVSLFQGSCLLNADAAFALTPGTWSISEASVVPLPAALPLFATGSGALGLFGWRRKRKAVAA